MQYKQLFLRYDLFEITVYSIGYFDKRFDDEKVILESRFQALVSEECRVVDAGLPCLFEE